MRSLSPFKSNNAAASRQKELQKTMCVPDEKRLNLGKLYEFAEREVASKKKGDVVLYVRTAKGPSSGEDTFKASTRPKKISTAKVAELEAVEWFDNSIKSMLNTSSMYSAEVQQALADIVYIVATHNRVVLSDPQFLALLKVVVEAKRVPPDRKCPDSPVLVQQPSAGVPDIPPPIVTTKQPAEEANQQVVELTTTMNRLLTQMEKNGQQRLELRDDHGDLVAVASVIRNDDAMRLLLCIDEPVSGACVAPATQGVSVHAGREALNWHGKGPRSEAQNLRVARFLKLAEGFDAQILAGPKAQPVVQANSSEALNTKALAQQLALVYDHLTPAALTAALHSLSKAMSLNQAINDANEHRIWLDKKGNVRFDEVIGAELVASAEFVTKSNGDRILTVQSAYAYEQQGQKGMWGSVLSPNSGTNPPGLRLNTKADYDSAFNASEIQTKVEGLMEFTQTFQNALDALAKVQNAV